MKEQNAKQRNKKHISAHVHYYILSNSCPECKLKHKYLSSAHTRHGTEGARNARAAHSRNFDSRCLTEWTADTYESTGVCARIGKNSKSIDRHVIVYMLTELINLECSHFLRPRLNPCIYTNNRHEITFMSFCCRLIVSLTWQRR